MLDTLDQVDWGSLTHAYGSADDLPALLRALASGDKEASKNAIYELFGNIWHQGTVYEATAYAVPFLIEVLESPSVDCKPDIVHLLQALATGNSYLDVHQHLDGYSKERKTPEFSEQVQQELGYVRAAHLAVVEGTPLYLRLLHDTNPTLRFLAPYLLAACVERVADIDGEIRRCIVDEVDEAVRASLIIGLNCLWRRAAPIQSEPFSTADRTGLMAALMKPDQPPLVRLVAALSLAELSGNSPCPEAIPVLRETIAPSLVPLGELPWCEGEALRMVKDRLHRQPALRLQLFLELLRHPDAKVKKDAIFAVEELCREQRSARCQAAPVFGRLLADRDTEVRRCAATALAQIGSAARLVVEALVAALDDKSPDVRSSAGVALSKIHDERAVRYLVEFLSDSKTQHSAIDSLKRLGPTALPAVPALRKLLRSAKNGQLQLRVALVLGEIGPEARSALPDLIAALHNPGAAGGVAYALGQWGPDAWEAVSDLMFILDAADDLVRRNAARALGHIGPAAEMAIPSLTELLDDRDHSVRAHAAIALWQIKQGYMETAVETLLDVFAKNSDSKRHDAEFACKNAVEFLGLIGPHATRAASILKDALGHNSHWVRVHAACSLWKITSAVEPILPVLLEELKCQPAGILVVRCLGEMGPHAMAAVPALKRLIDSEVSLQECGSLDSWINDEEAFCTAANEALDRLLRSCS